VLLLFSRYNSSPLDIALDIAAFETIHRFDLSKICHRPYNRILWNERGELDVIKKETKVNLTKRQEWDSCQKWSGLRWSLRSVSVNHSTKQIHATSEKKRKPRENRNGGKTPASLSQLLFFPILDEALTQGLWAHHQVRQCKVKPI